MAPYPIIIFYKYEQINEHNFTKLIKRIELIGDVSSISVSEQQECELTAERVAGSLLNHLKLIVRFISCSCIKHAQNDVCLLRPHWILPS